MDLIGYRGNSHHSDSVTNQLEEGHICQARADANSDSGLSLHLVKQLVSEQLFKERNFPTETNSLRPLDVWTRTALISTQLSDLRLFEVFQQCPTP